MARKTDSIVAALRETVHPPAATPALIVFGLDDAKKSHASWFAAADADLAEKAAGLMGLWVLGVTTDEHRAEAAKLAAGRVFASGKGFVPFCKSAAYDRLRAFEGAYQPEAPAEVAAEGLPAIVRVPATWGDVEVGGLVLASEGEGQGWFEAVIAEARGDNVFTLRWRDWPDLAAFARRVEHLALLTPAAAKSIA